MPVTIATSQALAKKDEEKETMYRAFVTFVYICFSVVHGEVSGSTLPAPQKSQYVVGGFISDLPSNFLNMWRPLLETYLSESVGSLYNPPINFTLIPVDYTPETRSQVLIPQGKVDFVCTSYFLKLRSLKNSPK